MHPMGAAGLALAGSIGGWVLFGFTVKEVGVETFMRIIRHKRSLYFMIIMPIFAQVVYEVNGWVLTLIR
jgi:putative peptidoglycan lipid II flippase